MGLRSRKRAGVELIGMFYITSSFHFGYPLEFRHPLNHLLLDLVLERGLLQMFDALQIALALIDFGNDLVEEFLELVLELLLELLLLFLHIKQKTRGCE